MYNLSEPPLLNKNKQTKIYDYDLEVTVSKTKLIKSHLGPVTKQQQQNSTKNYTSVSILGNQISHLL